MTKNLSIENFPQHLDFDSEFLREYGVSDSDCISFPADSFSIDLIASICR